MDGSMETSAAIYVRLSALDDREGNNRSLGAQERECRAWAECEGLDVGPVCREAVGTSASRFNTKAHPQMERALAEMGSSYTTLISYFVDRLTRRGMGAVGYLLDRAEAAGGRIITNDNLDTDNDSSHLGAAFLSERARMERVKLSERVCAAKEQHRRQGRCGLTPTYLLEEPAAKYLPIPRLFALVAAIVAAVCVCLSLTVEQAASTMAVTAVLTGETAHYKTKA